MGGPLPRRPPFVNAVAWPRVRTQYRRWSGSPGGARWQGAQRRRVSEDTRKQATQASGLLRATAKRRADFSAGTSSLVGHDAKSIASSSLLALQQTRLRHDRRRYWVRTLGRHPSQRGQDALVAKAPFGIEHQRASAASGEAAGVSVMTRSAQKRGADRKE